MTEFLDRLAAALWLVGLPDAEREAIVEHQILGRTFRETAARIGLSRQRAAQLYLNGMRRLRRSEEAKAA